MATEIILRKDSEWSAINGEACRVIEFTPFATIEDGRIVSLDATLPYGSVKFECIKFAGNAVGFINHKLDFQHLWAAFKERGIRQDEEGIIFWYDGYLRGLRRLLSIFMPKLCVMICAKGAFELMSDPHSQPELQGLARFDAQKPIEEWSPEAMK